MDFHIPNEMNFGDFRKFSESRENHTHIFAIETFIKMFQIFSRIIFFYFFY